VAYLDLAAELATEVQLLRAVQAELAAHAEAREQAYRYADLGALARSLPGLAEVGGPALVACMGPAARFGSGPAFRCYTWLAPKASETGGTARKGQPDEQGRLQPAAHHPHPRRRHRPQAGPQLARIYHTQMVERGKDHLGATCVVAAHLAERAWAVMNRQMPYVICDTDATPLTPEQAKAIIAERYTVPADVRARRRSKKTTRTGKAPQQVHKGHANNSRARSAATRQPSPQPS